MSTVLDLAQLAPSIQEAVLHAATVDGAETVTERALRGVLRHNSWLPQEAVWAAPRREKR